MLYRLIGVGFCICFACAAVAQDTVDSPGYWLAKAQNDAGQIADPAEKAGVLTSLAFQWSSIGDAKSANDAIAAANTTAGQIADSGGRFRAYLAIAGYADQYQDDTSAQHALAAAQAASAAVQGSAERADAANQVASLHRVVDGLNASLPQIRAEPDPVKRAQALVNLAIAFAQAGPRHHADYTGAAAATTTELRAVKDAQAAGMIESMLVQAQAGAGDLDAAAATARTINPPAASADAYTVLSEAYTKSGAKNEATDAITRLATAAAGCPDDRRAAAYLNIARARQALGDTAGALGALDLEVGSANRLEPADRSDAISAAARLRADLGDTAGAAVLSGDAAAAARRVTDPQDTLEVMMSVAAAQARCGLGAAAQQLIATAVAAVAGIPADKRHPDGDPPAAAYLDIIRAAATAGDFATAQSIAAGVNDAHLKHDAVLAIAEAQVNLAQYQAAEDLVQKEGSVDAEAAVCGMISASLARTRTAAAAERWVNRLNNPSDKIAAHLAVAEVQMSKMPAGK